ncbi:ABC-2 type transport system permease protein [Amycolatopsis arida]|uniref:Transport permease protein n=1 Tax=Amycolatopsis arida TaxID=587909 RepID=A0A1I5PT91_9PSEU|nr:ABC transporter permease [Amycolatopsis arida]TDX98598.1 ABC-2 type transport system permease protein [Amycolatopsis arida]SFP37292.1 ABC-2 type transport system permease protein [Amycolatopsis arida]
MTQATDQPAGSAGTAVRTFGAVLWRDVFVTGRELGPFVAQVVIQPFFMLFIFGTVLTSIGFVRDEYVHILLPGIVALNGFMVALQNTTMPLVLDFSWTREIEDRLLAPIPIPLVAVEKMVFGALRGIVAALLMIPVGFLLLEGVHWPASAWPGVLGLIALGSLAGAAIGMMIGTLVEARRINIMFAVVLVPLMFTGSTQFPWHGLDHLRWFQVVCAINPLTYASEGMRHLLLGGELESIPLWVDIPVLVGACVVFGAIGIKGFLRRALD